jgi:hypothetical protein
VVESKDSTAFPSFFGDPFRKIWGLGCNFYFIFGSPCNLYPPLGMKLLDPSGPNPVQKKKQVLNFSRRFRSIF